MYTLYACPGTASFAPQMVLEEGGLPHTVVEVDIAQGMHRTPEYLSVNPTGKVPALRLETGAVMTEAAAICLYLADTHQLTEIAPSVSEPNRPLFLKWLLYLATSVQDHYKRFYYPERYSADGIHASAIKEQSLILLKDSWQPLEAHLSSDGPYILGSRHSVADTYLVMLASWYPDQDEFRAHCPHVARCFDLVAARPIIHAGLSRQSTISVGRT